MSIFVHTIARYIERVVRMVTVAISNRGKNKPE